MFTYSNGRWEVYRRFQENFLFGGRGLGSKGVMWGKFLRRNFSWGKRISMKGAQNFLEFKKKMKKINMKSFFSTESKEYH